MWPNRVQVLVIAAHNNAILFLFQPQTLYAQVESHGSKLQDVHGGRIPQRSTGGGSAVLTKHPPILRSTVLNDRPAREGGAGLDARIPGLKSEPKSEADGDRGSAGSPPPSGELQALNKAVVTPGWTAFVPFISTLH